MISKLSLVWGLPGASRGEAARNLALEKYLTAHVADDEVILYLWQNRKTVVIGKNQNPWKQCRVEELLADGGQLARRPSGGGAVFHDLGNLNFSFCAKKENYDVDRQLEVILLAVRRIGIPAQKSGRNDLTAEGRKFSGNAFCETGEGCCHHGTIMVDVDSSMLERYLTVSPQKLASKGVDSVRSRVVNLREYRPELTVEDLSEALYQAFGQVYGLPVSLYGIGNPVGGTPDLLREVTRREPTRDVAAHRDWEEEPNHADTEQRDWQEGPACISAAQTAQRLEPYPIDFAEVFRLTEEFSSWEWLYGRKIPFTVSYEGRFSWGGAELALEVNEGVIRSAVCYSDAMDQDFIDKAGRAIEGCRFRTEDIGAALKRLERSSLHEQMVKDLSSLPG